MCICMAIWASHHERAWQVSIVRPARIRRISSTVLPAMYLRKEILHSTKSLQHTITMVLLWQIGMEPRQSPSNEQLGGAHEVANLIIILQSTRGWVLAFSSLSWWSCIGQPYPHRDCGKSDAYLFLYHTHTWTSGQDLTGCKYCCITAVKASRTKTKPTLWK